MGTYFYYFDLYAAIVVPKLLKRNPLVKKDLRR